MSDLEPNEPTLKFAEFYGPNILQMPLLIRADLVPASTAQIMQARLDGKLSWDTYYDSGDGIMYHPDGRVKLVHDAKPLREITYESTLHDGALVLPNDAWETLDGEVLSKEDVQKYAGRRQSESDVKLNPFWRFLSHNDQALLENTIEEIFSKVKKRHDRDDALGICVGCSQNALTMRQWCIGSGSLGYAYGSFDLDYGGRLVGVAPDVHKSTAQTDKNEITAEQ
ncbi:hypothetical protein HZB03_00690 [Candidatus Woesearchaeota archaeon]|nr:hypothetical protein [Candidatus Woesearchaeota archaeon]